MNLAENLFFFLGDSFRFIHTARPYLKLKGAGKKLTSNEKNFLVWMLRQNCQLWNPEQTPLTKEFWPNYRYIANIFPTTNTNWNVTSWLNFFSIFWGQQIFKMPTLKFFMKPSFPYPKLVIPGRYICEPSSSDLLKFLLLKKIKCHDQKFKKWPSRIFSVHATGMKEENRKKWVRCVIQTGLFLVVAFIFNGFPFLNLQILKF